MNRNVILLVAAILAFFAAIVASQDAGEILGLNAVSWLGVGSGLFAAAHLP